VEHKKKTSVGHSVFYSILSAFALPCLVTLVSSHGTAVQNVLEPFAFLGTEPDRIYKLSRICKAHFKGWQVYVET
jgi:hypothetical protein